MPKYRCTCFLTVRIVLAELQWFEGTRGPFAIFGPDNSLQCGGVRVASSSIEEIIQDFALKQNARFSGSRPAGLKTAVWLAVIQFSGEPHNRLVPNKQPPTTSLVFQARAEEKPVSLPVRIWCSPCLSLWRANHHLGRDQMSQHTES